MQAFKLATTATVTPTADQSRAKVRISG